MFKTVVLSSLFTLLALSSPLPAAEVHSLDSSINLRSTIKARQFGSSANDLVNGECRAVSVIFARGTTEPGNIGTVVGPPLSDNLDEVLGADNVAFQGVDYPADVAGFLQGGDDDGAATMADLATQAANDCADTQIVLSGYRFVIPCHATLLLASRKIHDVLTATYSQGAQVVSKAAEQLSADVAARVSAVVLFGNPNGNDPVPNIDDANVEVFCNAGDLICAGQAIVLAAHLTYGSDTDEAAEFIAGKVNV